VLYLVAHPPLDSQGDPLWQPVPVSLPARSTIGTVARAFTPQKLHRQPPLAVAAEYRPAALPALAAGSTRMTSVRIINSGIHPWLASGPSAFTLTYHLLTSSADLSRPISPFTSGVLAYGQAATPIPRDVLPGSAVTVRVPLAVPTKPGVYRVVWDLQEGAGIWLSQLGVRPAAQTIHVVAIVPVLSATPTPTPRAAQPKEKLQFIADTAIRDGTVVQPVQAFAKGWLVFNGGSIAWQQGWVLQNISGRSFAAKTITVPPTEACRSVNVIATLHAPNNPGRYKGVWQMRDPQGHLFGDRLTVVVVVAGIPVSPTPTPIVTAAPTPTQATQPGHPTPTPTPVG
jgi:Ig-like domain from next to BRCA1 gene